MFRYDFRTWNDEQFAKLCNALLVENISEKIRPFFTVGTDGGRDADYEGKGYYGYHDWEGRWIFQYKFHDCSLHGVQKARQLIKKDLKAELDKVTANHSPDNFILLTNVPFSGVLGTGTHDWFDELMKQYPSIKHAEVWDYTKIEALLDQSPEIRKAHFPNMEFGEAFVKDVARAISESPAFDAMAQLFSAAAKFKGEIKPIPEKDVKEVTDHLWKTFENLTLLSSGLNTISNFMYAWPELRRLHMILENVEIDGFNFEFGEWMKIETKGGLVFNVVLQDEMVSTGPEGGSLRSGRTTFAVLRRLFNTCQDVSQKIHLDIMILLEKYPSVARRIAGSARGEFETTDEFFPRNNPLLAPMQHIRQKAVSDVLGELSKWLEDGPGYGSAFDGGGLEVSGRFYGAVDLCAAMRDAIQQVLRNPSTLVQEL